jgi:ketosteroid isomerase-like protein
VSESNIQLVKQGFDKFLSGDIPGFLELMAEDVAWDHRGPSGVPFNRMYQGRAKVGEFFKTLAETSETLAFEPREFFAAGDRVVALGFFRFKVRATGKEWESDFAMAFTVQNDHVTHWKPIFDKEAEAAAFSKTSATTPV